MLGLNAQTRASRRDEFPAISAAEPGALTWKAGTAWASGLRSDDNRAATNFELAFHLGDTAPSNLRGPCHRDRRGAREGPSSGPLTPSGIANSFRAPYSPWGSTWQHARANRHRTTGPRSAARPFPVGSHSLRRCRHGCLLPWRAWWHENRSQGLNGPMGVPRIETGISGTFTGSRRCSSGESPPTSVGVSRGSGSGRCRRCLRSSPSSPASQQKCFPKLPKPCRLASRQMRSPFSRHRIGRMPFKRVH
jgi:hypothetical protein